MDGPLDLFGGGGGGLEEFRKKYLTDSETRKKLFLLGKLEKKYIVQEW